MGYTREQIDMAWVVKATQKTPDDRASLCGEAAQTDADGNRYFVIPAHLKNCAYMLGYEIGEEYNPLMGDSDAPAAVNKGGRPRKVETE